MVGDVIRSELCGFEWYACGVEIVVGSLMMCLCLSHWHFVAYKINYRVFNYRRVPSEFEVWSVAGLVVQATSSIPALRFDDHYFERQFVLGLYTF